MCLLCAITSRIIGLFTVWVVAEYLHLRFWNASFEEIQASSRLQGAFFISLLLLFYGLLFLVPAMTRSGLKRRQSDGARVIYGLFFLVAFIYVLYLSVSLEPTRRAMEETVFVPAILPVVLFIIYFLCFVIPGTYAYELARRAGENVEVFNANRPHYEDDATRKDWRNIGAKEFSEENEDEATEEETSEAAILTYILVSAVVVIVSASIWLVSAIKFVPTQEWQDFASNKSNLAIITAVLTGIGVYVFFRSTARGSWLKTLVGVPVFAVFFGAFAFLFASTIAKAVPIALSFTKTVQTERLLAEVVERDDRANRRGCDYAVFVKLTPDAFGDRAKLCGVHPNDWNEMTPGRSISLVGQQTPYGIRYQEISRRTE